MTSKTPSKILLPSTITEDTFTGERFIPSVTGEIAWEHLHRYACALEICAGKEVLDIASGEGYGSYMISQVAKRVVGVDISSEAIQSAKLRYQSSNLSFVEGGCENIPLPDASVDVIVSFETIEHINDHKIFLKEALRVLRPEGTLLISSPEREIYNEQRNQIKNDFHKSEMSLDEFSNFLKEHFKNVSFARQGTLLASAIVPLPDSRAEPLSVFRDADGSLINDGMTTRAPYVIALCSNREIGEVIRPSIFDPGLSPTILSALKGGIEERDLKIQTLSRSFEAAQISDADERSRSLASELLKNQKINESLLLKIVALNTTAKSQAALLAASAAVSEGLKNTVEEQKLALGALRNAQLVPQPSALSYKKPTSLREQIKSFFNLLDGPLYAQPAKKKNNFFFFAVKAVIQLVYFGALGSLPKRIRLHTAADEVAQSGLFDRNFYLRENPEVKNTGADPILHYLTIGWRKGRNPHPLFNTGFYLGAFPDLRVSTIAPLVHYIRWGASERRTPHPLFDPEYYLSQFPRSDAAAADSPLRHYIEHGAVNSFNPHPLFDTKFYREQFKGDIGEMGVPLIHYLAGDPHASTMPNPLFDPEYYLAQYKDVAASKVNPLLHFALYGGKERRSTSVFFSSEIYVKNYLDLPEVSNPLAHFLRYGVFENRVPIDFDMGFFLEWCPEAARCSEGSFLYYVKNFALGGRSTLDNAQIIKGVQRIEQALHSSSLLCAPSDKEPVVSIIIPVFNQLKFTLRCLASLLESKPRVRFEVIVVNDCSTDSSELALSSLEKIRLITQETNSGFIASCNRGAEEARGKYLLFLNNDTHVLPGWLDELYETLLTYPLAGLVGSQLIYPDGVLQEAGGIIWKDGSAWNYGRGKDRNCPEYSYARSVDFCSGASILISRGLFMELGMFDAHYAPAYCEDADLALKVRKKGLRVIYQPFSRVVHFEGVSSGRDTTKGIKSYQVTNLKKLYERWKDTLKHHRPQGESVSLERDRGIEKRIFFADACTPTPDQDAGSVVADSWLSILISLGYQVTFVPQDNLLHIPRYTERLQRKGVYCLYTPYVTSIDEFLHAEGKNYDATIVLRHAVAAEVYEAFERYSPEIKSIFLPIDLHYIREKRRAELEGSTEGVIAALQTKHAELQVVAKSDITCVHSSFEKKEILSNLASAQVHVSPIITDVIGRARGFLDRKDICFMGGYRHTPNVDAVLFFIKEVLPLVHRELPDLKFKVVGNGVPSEILALASPQVEILGFVKDLTPLLNSIRLTVAPLRYGAGVKGKVGTSMSYGVPAVCTPMAVEGMDLVHEQEVLIGSTAEELASLVVRAYQDEKLWYHLSDSSMNRVEREYSTRANTEQIKIWLNSLHPAIHHAISVNS